MCRATLSRGDASHMFSHHLNRSQGFVTPKIRITKRSGITREWEGQLRVLGSPPNSLRKEQGPGAGISLQMVPWERGGCWQQSRTQLCSFLPGAPCSCSESCWKHFQQSRFLTENSVSAKWRVFLLSVFFFSFFLPWTIWIILFWNDYKCFCRDPWEP